MKTRNTKAVKSVKAVEVVDTVVVSVEQIETLLPADIAKAMTASVKASGKAVSLSEAVAKQIVASGKDAFFLFSPFDNNKRLKKDSKATCTPEQYAAIELLIAQADGKAELWLTPASELTKQLKAVEAERKAKAKIYEDGLAKAKTEKAAAKFRAQLFKNNVASATESSFINAKREARATLNQLITATLGDWRARVKTLEKEALVEELLQSGVPTKDAKVQAAETVAVKYGDKVKTKGKGKSEAGKPTPEAKPTLANLQVEAAAFLTGLERADETPLLPKEHAQLVNLLTKFKNANAC